MSVSFAIPNENEAVFLDGCLEKGVTEIHFVYLKLPGKIVRKKILDLANGLSVVVNFGQFASKSIRSGYADAKQINSQEVFNAEFVFNLESVDAKAPNKMHFSLLDEATAKIVKKKGTTIVFNLGQIDVSNPNKSAKILAVARQNYDVVKRYGLNFEIATFAENPDDMKNSKDLDAFKRLFFK